MPLRPYLDVLRTPGVPRLLGSAVLGRMPIGMAGLAIVLLVRQSGGSYATAGLVAGCYAISLGLTAPLLGRLIDRVGQTRVLLGCAGVCAAAFVGLGVAAEAGSRALLPVLAALGGASLPPVAACLRALWSELLGRGGELQAAFSVEAIVQELIFVVGPPLVALLAAAFVPAAAMVGIAVLLLAGIGVFAGAPASRSWRAEPRAADWAGPLRSPGIRAVLACIVVLAAAFGAVEVAVPAAAEGLGSRTLAGPLLALWAAGSMVGGLAFGGRGPGRPPERRLVGMLVLVAAGIAVLALVATRFQLGAGMVVAGLGIAPAIACLYLLIDRLAPAGTVTEAFTWVNSAFGTGIAIGNASGGGVVHRAGADAVFLLAAAAVVAAALLARLRRPALAERSDRPSPSGAVRPRPEPAGDRGRHGMRRDRRRLGRAG
jgi:MFS family permease